METTGIDGDGLGACEVEGDATAGAPNAATGAVDDEIGTVEDGVRWIGRIGPEGDEGPMATAGAGKCAAALPVASGVAVGAASRAKTGMVWLVAVVWLGSVGSAAAGSGINADMLLFSSAPASGSGGPDIAVLHRIPTANRQGPEPQTPGRKHISEGVARTA